MLVTLTALIALATPVVLDLPSTADGEERFVSGQGCSVTVKNDQVTGPSGCTFVVAIIDAEGNVQRTQYALKTKTVSVAANPEDDPRSSEDEPEESADAETAKDIKPKAAIQKSSPRKTVRKRTSSTRRASDTTLPIRIGPELVIQKDWSDFRYSIFGIAAVAVLFERFAFDIRWERGKPVENIAY